MKSMLSVTVSVITVGPLESFLNLLTFDTNEEKVEKDQSKYRYQEGKGSKWERNKTGIQKKPVSIE